MDDFQFVDDFEVKTKDDEVTITNYMGNSKNVVIPAEIQGKPVKAIDGAFCLNQLTRVEIPNSVTTIGNSAFAHNQLTRVEIPNNVTTIGSLAFAQNQLTRVEIPNSVTTIGDSAFYQNQLTSLEIPNSVTTIGDSAFRQNHLRSVKIPNSVTTIEDWAFAQNQLTSLEIPNSVTTIEDWAFAQNQLTSLKIPNSVTTIGDSAFAQNQLTRVEIPNSVTTIGALAFAQNQLTRVKIPNSVTTIGIYAFTNNQVTSITIGSGVNLGVGSEFTSTLVENGPSFDKDFDNYYNSQGKKAGTYTLLNNTDWSFQTAENKSPSKNRVFRVIGVITAIIIVGVWWFQGDQKKKSKPQVPVQIEAPQSEETTAYVNSDALNIRSSPTAESRLVTTLRKNAEVRILETAEGNWVKIRAGGKEGYVSKFFLRNP